MPTTEQVEAFARARLSQYVHNPPKMAVDLFGFTPTDYQAEAMLAVASGADVTWRAGHGVGKTATLALLVFWFLLTRPGSRVPTTAPTFRQVKDVLWAEIAYWYQRFVYKSALRLDRTRLSMRGYEQEWFAIGVASNRPQNLEGFHAEHILFIGDEAKGIPDPIFDAIDGALTTGGQRLYTSTPGSRSGRFYETHNGRLARYFRQIHTNGEHASRVNRAWLNQKREEWGEDSPIYLAKIRGEFPAEGDDVLIPLSYIDAAEDAYERTTTEGGGEGVALVPVVPLGPRAVLGCDVARHGHNETVGAYGSVYRVEWVSTAPRGELYETAAWLRQRRSGFAYSWVDRRGQAFGPEQTTRAELIGVDDTGVGGGVTSDLRKEGDPVLPIGFGEAATEKTLYANLKTEAAFMVRSLLAANARAMREGKAPTFAMVSHDRLRGQLSNLRTRPVNKGSGLGRVRILDPDDPLVDASDIPKGLRVSPDHAHAMIFMIYAARAASLAGVGTWIPPTPPRTPSEASGPLPTGARRYGSYIFGNRRAPR